MRVTVTRKRLPRILLIEDNPGDVFLLQLALRKAEFECDLMVLENGCDALAMVQGQGKYGEVAPPDLAILDLNIPRTTGSKLLNR